MTRKDFPVRWEPDLVFQGFIGPSEECDLVDADGGAWRIADPDACEEEGHQERVHPCGDGSFYCIRCGEEDIPPPDWARSLLKEIRDA